MNPVCGRLPDIRPSMKRSSTPSGGRLTRDEFM
jgi:hypothetical protein